MTASTVQRSVLTILCLLQAFSSHLSAEELDTQQTLTRIAFGSCIKQEKPLPIVDAIVRDQPQLMLMLGDNIYADTADMDVMKAKYAHLAAHSEFQKLRAHCPLLAVWDDHDYGINDGGADFPQKAEAQKLFMEFWNSKQNASAPQHAGVYSAAIYGPPGRRVQIILLDTRYFRSPLKQGDRRVGGPYLPDEDPKKTMLGEAQWAWLEQQLQQPAEVRLIGSGIQILASDAGQETWSNFPREQQRLYKLIQSTRAAGVILLSGDRHWAELSVQTEEVPYPLYDITSSSLNQLHPRGTPTENSRRCIDNTYHRENYGILQINWEQPEPTLLLDVRDMDGKSLLSKTLKLSALKFPAEAR